MQLLPTREYERSFRPKVMTVKTILRTENTDGEVLAKFLEKTFGPGKFSVEVSVPSIADISVQLLTA